LIEEALTLREQNRDLRTQFLTTLEKLRKTITQTEELAKNAQARVDPVPRLTKRECSVVTLIAGGYSNKQIAGMLGISFKTVVTHRTHIMEKLVIHETAGLVRFAVKYGLIRP